MPNTPPIIQPVTVKRTSAAILKYLYFRPVTSISLYNSASRQFIPASHLISKAMPDAYIVSPIKKIMSPDTKPLLSFVNSQRELLMSIRKPITRADITVPAPEYFLANIRASTTKTTL